MMFMDALMFSENCGSISTSAASFSILLKPVDGAGGFTFSESEQLMQTSLKTLQGIPLEQTTILDKMNDTFRPPLPPISMMLKWRVLVFARLHHCFGGEGG